MDSQLDASLDADITQVAVIGAGYDTRAWRFRRDGVVFFELDHAATQRDKRRRAPDRVISQRDAACALVPDDVGLPVRAINEHKTLASARTIDSGPIDPR